MEIDILNPTDLARGSGSRKTDALRHYANDDKASGVHGSRTAIEVFNSWAELGRDVIMTQESQPVID
jgi:hypothetical protein